ncbi:hypothetical protein DI09_3p650 [Mitosporidium daphniae]|uniref:Uncharacterized protein n=1 Tax=Mitosporidium daphniae TaxID=1485682 RepID=A0A098VQK6_9MICR|nr:uncharacterized protein DI09_3p650 [Mitosporidium daphniae]KGG51303.1 hypothetical protein DI09_3p650 [Mitosporidium daphniae]|eukprot:XP_013237730.1 uncharacterized protein DI09_3p650 [Mitosporidium daphniae]
MIKYAISKGAQSFLCQMTLARNRRSLVGSLFSIKDGYIEIKILNKEFFQANSTQVCLSSILYISQIKFIGMHFPVKRTPLNDDILICARHFFWKQRKVLWRLKSKVASPSILAHNFSALAQNQRKHPYLYSRECISYKSFPRNDYVHLFSPVGTLDFISRKYKARISELSLLVFTIEEKDVLIDSEQRASFKQLIGVLEQNQRILKSKYCLQHENMLQFRWGFFQSTSITPYRQE